MKALIVHPEFPITYWGYQYSMKLAGKKAALPPLGLLSFAALLPESWNLRLIDLNVEPLLDEHLEWADTVFLGGMHIQSPSMQQVIQRAKGHGLRTIVGGPGPTTADDCEYEAADIVFKGELEGRVDELLAVLDQPGRHVLPAAEEYPDLSEVPLPRYDLLELSVYASVGLQYSRGCPFKCEFCDIIEIFGRVPRVKSPTQVMAELDLLYGSGYRGSLFFVDDNFIGNAPAVLKMLPKLTAWPKARGFPFELYTEASLNLASNDALLDRMLEAGFTSVFLGIETPSAESLLETGKTQNLRMDLGESIERMTRKGLDLMGGFIVGFDNDTEAVFDLQREFINGSPIPQAMVGVLTALPGTALWRRLEREGRLREASSGDQFDRPNFEPAMDEATLLAGYADLMKSIYSEDAYYDRCEAQLERTPRTATRRKPAFADLAILLRTFFFVGVLSPRRGRCWRLLLKTLRLAPHAFAWAVAQIVKGEHLIRYTAENVVPRLELALAEVRLQRARCAVRGADSKLAGEMVPTISPASGPVDSQRPARSAGVLASRDPSPALSEAAR